MMVAVTTYVVGTVVRRVTVEVNVSVMGTFILE